MCRLSVTARRNMSALLPKRRVINVIIALLTVTLPLFTHCLTINKPDHPEIVAKTRVELTPVTINASPYDVIRISAPVINEKAVYYIYKPNGDAMKLDITSPKLRDMKVARDVQPLLARFVNNMKPIISQNNNYDVFSVYARSPPKDLFSIKVAEMEQNDFMIGPLSTEDHGNWVLSVYTKDFNNDWVELFQVNSVTITEYVPLTPSKPILNLGETLSLSFAFPITDLESCELVAPRSTFDRLYNRNEINMNNCGFSVPSVTKMDAGIWRIVGVGKIVYEGEASLSITIDNTTTC